MKTNEPIWKKFLTVAIFAFILGLLPYFWMSIKGTLLDMGPSGITLTAYSRDMLAGVWAFAVRYAPHLLSLYIISIAILIFFEGQNPDRTILWLITLAIFPIFGIILYVILGPDLKRMKNRKLFRPCKSYPCITSPLGQHVPSRVQKLSVLAYRSAAAEIWEHGEVEILIDGEETFSSIKRALKQAKRYINIEYFIFKDDRLGREIIDILCERAAAGVRIRMMTDGVGSWKLGYKAVKKMHGAGVSFKTYMPVSFPFFHSTINFRNHRKIIVVDGDVAFTGGLNVGVEYLGEGHLGNWRDTHALFRGDSVYALNSIFLEDWRVSAGEELFPDDKELAPTDPEACGNMPFLPMQIVASGSNSPWHAIGQMYLSMIAEAKERIWITSPYLVPDTAIMSALQVAALSGVDVRILIPSTMDHFLVYWAGRSNIETLLRAGVRIWRYTNGFVHAKTLLMDNDVASVGTANLDNRSLEINAEVQAFIYDEEICESFASQFLLDINDAEECILSSWEKRGLKDKILESVGRLWTSQI